MRNFFLHSQLLRSQEGCITYILAEKGSLREPTNHLACRHSPAAVLTWSGPCMPFSTGPSCRCRTIQHSFVRSCVQSNLDTTQIALTVGLSFGLEEKSLVSSWSKEEGTRISRVEECLVTIIGIEEVIVACHALLPPFFHLLFSSWNDDGLRKKTDSFLNQTIIIQNLSFFPFKKKNLNTFPRGE